MDAGRWQEAGEGYENRGDHEAILQAAPYTPFATAAKMHKCGAQFPLTPITKSRSSSECDVALEAHQLKVHVHFFFVREPEGRSRERPAWFTTA